MVTLREPRVMLKCADGFIMSKRETPTADGGIFWQFSKSPGTPAGLAAAKETFAEHGYDVVKWDDNQIASDGMKMFTTGEEGQ